MKETREQKILRMYEEGRTLQEVGNMFNFSRSRAQQIVIREIKKSIKKEFNFIPSNKDEIEQLNMAAKERMSEIYLTRKKVKSEYHDKEIVNRIRIRMEQLPHYSNFMSLNNYADALKENFTDVKRYFPKISEELLNKKRNRWSEHYNNCRECGTITVKHRSHGLCKNCYFKSDIFKETCETSRLRNQEKWKKQSKEYIKEYNKRPEVIEKIKRRNDIKNFDGNREKAMIRDNYMCQICNITQKESLEKIGRDLYVVHINDIKNNNLDNLVTICKRCHNKRVTKKMIEGRNKSEN